MKGKCVLVHGAKEWLVDDENVNGKRQVDGRDENKEAE